MKVKDYGGDLGGWRTSVAEEAAEIAQLEHTQELDPRVSGDMASGRRGGCPVGYMEPQRICGKGEDSRNGSLVQAALTNSRGASEGQ